MTRCGLLTEYKGFSQAFLFRLPDSTFAFEVWYRDNGRILKSRTLMTAAEAQRFQQRIAESLRQLAPIASGGACRDVDEADAVFP